MTKKLKTQNKMVNVGISGFSKFDSYVTLEVLRHNEVCKGDNHTVEIEYRYLDDLGNDITPGSNVFNNLNTSALIDAFSSAIESMIPAGLSHTELSDYKVLIGAKIKMAEALSIPLSEIDIVDVVPA